MTKWSNNNLTVGSGLPSGWSRPVLWPVDMWANFVFICTLTLGPSTWKGAETPPVATKKTLEIPWPGPRLILLEICPICTKCFINSAVLTLQIALLSPVLTSYVQLCRQTFGCEWTNIIQIQLRTLAWIGQSVLGPHFRWCFVSSSLWHLPSLLLLSLILFINAINPQENVGNRKEKVLS